MARASETVVAAALLVLVTVAAGVMLYLWVSSSTTSASGSAEAAVAAVRGCRLHVDAAYEDYNVIRAYLRVQGCRLRVRTGYLEAADGATYRLVAGFQEPLEPGRVYSVALAAAGAQAPPGSYRLRLVADNGLEASTRVVLGRRLGEAVALAGTAEELNNTRVNTTAFNVTVVSSVANSYGDYNITVLVCANPGYNVTLVYAEILNATGQPPLWIGPWYVYTYTVEYTYPDCAIWYWSPLLATGQPFNIIIAVSHNP